MWNLRRPEDAAVGAADLVAPYAAAGLPVYFVELGRRPGRPGWCATAGRTGSSAKPSKRDLAWSDAHLHERESNWVMNTDPTVPLPADAVLGRAPAPPGRQPPADPGAAAEQIVVWLAGN